jgi:hypothetical protein
LALVCSDEILVERLEQRPIWRGSHEPNYIEEHLRYNRWFKTYTGQPVIQLVDTTQASFEETTQQVAAWIDENI